jgi:hypothetical protein
MDRYLAELTPLLIGVPVFFIALYFALKERAASKREREKNRTHTAA